VAVGVASRRFSNDLAPDDLLQRVHSRVSGARIDKPAAWSKALVSRRPELRDDVLAAAEHAMGGMLVLPGTGGKLHFVGSPPRWMHRDVDDREYLYSLNRMEHWKTLATAFSLTGDRRFAEKITDELRDWLAACRRPPLDPARARELFNDGVTWASVLRAGIRVLERWPRAIRYVQAARGAVRSIRRHARGLRTASSGSWNGHAPAPLTTAPWRSLEAGIRLYDTWPAVLHHLVHTDVLDADLLLAIARSVEEQAEILETISPIIWPDANHNHYLAETLGLLTAACLFPEMERAGQWKTRAMNELERCAQTQLMPDGGHVEGCPHYHNGCFYLFCLALLRAREHGLEFSGNYIHRVRGALEWSVQTMRPTGRGVPWGDSDADDLAVRAAIFGYVCFGEVAPLRIAARLAGPRAIEEQCFKHLWQIQDLDDLLSVIDREDLEGDDRATSFPLVRHQRQLKQVALRTGWEPDSLSVFFACRTPVYNGHAHIDPASFDFTALGHTMVCDPGRFTYRQDEDRRRFKSTAWHNTLTLSGREPFEYITGWHFGRQRSGDVAVVRDEDGLLAAESFHENYAPSVHRRLVALIDERFMLVLDLVTSVLRSTSVQIYYHLDSTDVLWHVLERSATADFHSRDGRDVAPARLSLFCTDNLQGELLAGKVADKIDQSRDSTRLRLQDSSRVFGTRCYASVLVPYRHAKSAQPPHVTDLAVSDENGVMHCAFTLRGTRHLFAWGEGSFERI
jgi:hypothetical protein